MAYKHHGFWQCMDTMRDKNILKKMWREKKAPWTFLNKNQINFFDANSAYKSFDKVSKQVFIPV